MNNTQLLSILNQALELWTHKVYHSDFDYGGNARHNISYRTVSSGLCTTFAVLTDIDIWGGLRFVTDYIKPATKHHQSAPITTFWFPLNREGDIERIEIIKQAIKHYISNPIQDEIHDFTSS